MEFLSLIYSTQDRTASSLNSYTGIRAWEFLYSKRFLLLRIAPNTLLRREQTPSRTRHPSFLYGHFLLFSTAAPALLASTPSLALRTLCKASPMLYTTSSTLVDKRQEVILYDCFISSLKCARGPKSIEKMLRKRSRSPTEESRRKKARCYRPDGQCDANIVWAIPLSSSISDRSVGSSPSEKRRTLASVAILLIKLVYFSFMGVSLTWVPNHGCYL